ncbi:MAG: helix-turn-helix transcriptional regulator [Kineosporiaceae bacterium]|nr:helix-turn-helix transcriptional regulator [Kineosporiaceae bacterium]
MPVEEPHRVLCHLDRLLDERGLTLSALAETVGVSVVNLSILKNNRARAVRFSTLTAICEALGCQVGDLFTLAPPTAEDGPDAQLAARGSPR